MLKIMIPLLLSCLMFYWGEMILSSLFVFLLIFLLNPVSMELSFMSTEMDFISWNLLLLSMWIVPLSVMSSTSINFFKKMKKLYLLLMNSMLLFLTLTFITSDYFIFYMSFEACLVPIFLMILGWGYQPERLQASLSMLFYTLFGSLPLFILILVFYTMTGSCYMFLNTNFFNSLLTLICLSSAFLIKFPMYGVHLWLLKAHVEAPVAGSMILAGILLKLGGYGLIRFLPMSVFDMNITKNLLIILSVCGAIKMSMACLRMTDMKLIVAASSVVHMSTCIAAIFIMTEWSMKSCLLMMVAHGLCSSGLFSFVGMVYERTSSRSMLVSKGLLNMCPSLSMWCFLLLAANMAAPPTINLAAEIIILLNVISWNKTMIFLLFILSFFSASYSIYLYSLSQHGVFNKVKSTFKNGLNLEYMVLFLHWMPLNILVMNLTFMV